MAVDDRCSCFCSVFILFRWFAFCCFVIRILLFFFFVSFLLLLLLYRLCNVHVIKLLKHRKTWNTLCKKRLRIQNQKIRNNKQFRIVLWFWLRIECSNKCGKWLFIHLSTGSTHRKTKKQKKQNCSCLNNNSVEWF